LDRKTEVCIYKRLELIRNLNTDVLNIEPAVIGRYTCYWSIEAAAVLVLLKCEIDN